MSYEGDEEFDLDPFEDEQSDYPDADPFADDAALFEVLDAISNDFGISNIRDIVIVVGEGDSNDLADLRAVRFDSPEEAAAYLYGAGIFSLSEIYDLGDGVYAISVIDCTNPPCD